MVHRGLGLGGNGRLPSSAGIRWLLTHIARSSGLGSGRRAPGEDPSSPYPRQYASASQGSVGGCRPSACPRWCPGYRLPRQSPPPLGSASVLHRNPQPASLCRVPPFPRHPPRPTRPSLPHLSGGYGKRLGSNWERRLHPGGLRTQVGCGLRADPTTLPAASSHPRDSAARLFRKRSAPRAGSREPGVESLTRERAASRAPASFPGRRRVCPLRPNSGTAAGDPTDL